MSNWLHRLFNPHCPQCAAESICESCENWNTLYEQEKAEKKRLLDIVLGSMEDDKEEIQPAVAPEPVIPRVVPWHMKREILEKEDAQRKKVLDEHQKEIEKLEKELKIPANLGMQVDPSTLEAINGE